MVRGAPSSSSSRSRWGRPPNPQPSGSRWGRPPNPRPSGSRWGRPPNPRPSRRFEAALFASLLFFTAACGQEGIGLPSLVGAGGGDASTASTTGTGATSTSGAGGGSGGGAGSTSGTGSGGASTSAATTSAATTSSSTGSGGPGTPLVIVDWNTHNFFDTTDDNPLGTVLTAADYAAKRKSIGATLKALNPDIAVLAEVENKAILDDLDQSELANAYPTTILASGNDPRGINVGVLSKIAPDSFVSHKSDTFTKLGTTSPSYRYARDCIEIHYTFAAKKIILLGVHFKAKAAPDDPDKRLAEAQHTRAIADALHAANPSAAILVLGDFNDTPGSPPLAALGGATPNLYVDSAASAPAPERYSFDYMSNLELIDHQMANPTMATFLDAPSILIAHGAGIDDGSKSASDHAPIRATYIVH